MSTSSLLKFNIDNDLIYGNTHFVEEGATFNWEIALMSNVSLYNGTGTRSFKTITFTTNSNKTQVLLGFNVLDRNGNVLSQIGANGRLKILEIYDANYGTNNRLRQYEDKKVQLTDTRYAQVVESGVDTGLNRFQLSIIPTDDLILEPVVSDVGYSVYYQCTAVTCDYALDETYRTYSDSHTISYNNRLTCMSYDIDIPNINWSTYYFTVLGYYDGNTHISSYCPDTNSETIYYTLDHWAHNQNGGMVSNSIDYKYENMCERKADYWCSYCAYRSEKDYDIYHAHSTESKSWESNDEGHWHNIICDRCGDITDTTDVQDHGKWLSDGDDIDTVHKCEVCDFENKHVWPKEGKLDTNGSDCGKQRYLFNCLVCNQGRYEYIYGDFHDYGSWQEGTDFFKSTYDTGYFDHIKYRECNKCGTQDTSISFGSSKEDCKANGTWYDWLDANKNVTGYDAVRYCTACGYRETHTHGNSCYQEYGNNIGGTRTLKNAEYCIDPTGVICQYDLTVVAHYNKCNVTGKALDVVSGTYSFSNTTSHEGDESAFKSDLKRLVNAIGNTFGATAEDKCSSTCKYCGYDILKPFLVKVNVNGEIITESNKSWILTASLERADSKNNGVWFSIIGIGNYIFIIT